MTLPVYHGRSIQRGYGLGGIFRGLFRSALPFLKQGAKTVGRQALRSGIDLAQDVLKGQGVKHAAKRRMGELGQRLLSRQKGGGILKQGPSVKRSRKSTPRERSAPRRRASVANRRKGPLKRKTCTKTVTFAKGSRRSRRTYPDIFG